MRDLRSPQWAELSDAYGSAVKILELLRQLFALPNDKNDSEPPFSLWSTLANQGDVFQ